MRVKIGSPVAREAERERGGEKPGTGKEGKRELREEGEEGDFGRVGWTD